MARISSGVGALCATSTSGLTQSDDVASSGFMRARLDGGKFRLYRVVLADRQLEWYSTQRPPDKVASATDLRHKIDLQYYRVQPPPDDLKALFAFALLPSFDAPLGQEGYHFVLAMEHDLNAWKDLLTAASLGGAVPTASLLQANTANLNVDMGGDRTGFLYVKERGADWRSWKLRWCVLSGAPPTLFWAKPPKVGKDDVRTVGQVDLEGAKIHCGILKSPVETFLKIEPVTGKTLLMAAGSRKEAVEWTNMMQYLSGHMVGLEADQTDQEDAAILAQKKGLVFQRSMPIAKTGHVFFKQGNETTWNIKFLWLRENQLHWFKPVLPNADKIQSDDAILLQEPFVIQGAPKHSDTGRCFTVLTPVERYFFIGLTEAETDSWINALQLVWHCMRPNAPGGWDATQLNEQLEQLRNPLIEDSIETMGLVHWSTDGTNWDLVQIVLREAKLFLHEPSTTPGSVGSSKLTLPIHQQVTVTQIPVNMGAHGFVLAYPDKTEHKFATHDEQAAASWEGVLHATKESNACDPTQSPTGYASPTAKAAAADFGELDNLDDLEGLMDLDELLDLDIPSTDDTPAAPAEPEPEGVLQGLLEKKGDGALGTWQTRFFVLDTNALSYFEAKGDAGGKKGEYLLSDVTSIEMMEDSVTTFKVLAGDRDVCLRAKTRREAAMWVEAFNDVLNGNFAGMV